jgi:hypothetical protein
MGVSETIHQIFIEFKKAYDSVKESVVQYCHSSGYPLY